MQRKIWMSATAVLLLAACDQKPAEQPADTTADNRPVEEVAPPETVPTALPAQDFANRLAASDAFEMATSRLAADRASTPSIKAFARKMIDAHTASTDKLKKDVATLTPAITPDPALSADQQQKLDALRQLNGTAFEQAYIADQVAAHEAALGVVQAYAGNGTEPVLKRFAADAVKMVTDHRDEARRLAMPAPATAP